MGTHYPSFFTLNKENEADDEVIRRKMTHDSTFPDFQFTGKVILIQVPLTRTVLVTVFVVQSNQRCIIVVCVESNTSHLILISSHNIFPQWSKFSSFLHFDRECCYLSGFLSFVHSRKCTLMESLEAERQWNYRTRANERLQNSTVSLTETPTGTF